MVNSIDFAKRLQRVLEFYGISATAFAEEIEFSRSTISHLLSGRNKPSLEFVMKVLQKFPEVELYWLLNGKGKFPSQEKQTPSPALKTNVQKNASPEVLQNSIKENQSQNIKNDIDTSNKENIDRIVIFYKDGTFKAYNN